MHKTKSTQELISTLQNGDPALYNKIHFSLSGDFLNITTWSSFTFIQNITRNTSENELAELKSYIKVLAENDSILNEFLITKNIFYILCFNSDKAGIVICKESKNKIEWFI